MPRKSKIDFERELARTMARKRRRLYAKHCAECNHVWPLHAHKCCAVIGCLCGGFIRRDGDLLD